MALPTTDALQDALNPLALHLLAAGWRLTGPLGLHVGQLHEALPAPRCAPVARRLHVLLDEVVLPGVALGHHLLLVPPHAKRDVDPEVLVLLELEELLADAPGSALEAPQVGHPRDPPR